MFTKFLNIFACAAIIASDTGTAARPLKVKGVVMNKPHNTILITGGSSGFGMALVERLLAEGHTVITCSRGEEKLKKAKAHNPNLHIRVCDVGIPEQREELAGWVLENFPDVNVLINNAGIQNRMNLLYQDKTWDEYEQEIRINLSGPIHMTMLLANHLAKQENAAIINVSGGVAFTPMAATPIYSAVKAGVHSFTLSLRDQFANTGVEMFEIIPPAVAGTHLGGRGLRTAGVPLDEYIDSLMKGLHGDEAEIAYDTSARVYRASRDQLDERTAEITRMIPIPVPAGSQEQAVSGELVYVEGGTFMMGSTGGTDRERPVHHVTVGSFFIGKYEVTQKEWTEVMGSNPGNFKGTTLPVEQLDWYDAIAYCNKRSVKEGLTPAYTINGQNVTWDKSADGYRLPTEAEWEYAARGGKNSSTQFTYAGSNTAGDVAWYSENSGNRTHETGQKEPNALGLYDMSGNVWEWCWDLYEDYSSEAQTNPSGAVTGLNRILRGGPYYDGAGVMRVAYRGSREPSYKYNSIGLRVVRPRR